MHRLSATFVLGYHGCDKQVAEALLAGEPFKHSANDYGWLGPGVYFWEANPQRGLDFANESARRKNSTVKSPAVNGAIIDLGNCLDMAEGPKAHKAAGVKRELSRTMRAMLPPQ